MSARAALAVALLTACAAGGGSAYAAPSTTPKVSSLPSAHVPEVPMRGRPTRIGAGERAAGFWVVRPKSGYANPKQAWKAPQYAQIYATEAAATAASKGRQIFDATRDSTCFVTQQNRGTDTQVVEWSGGFTGTATLQPYDGTGVFPLRSEQLVVEPDGSAKLVVAQAWVDVATLGVRLVSRSTVPLAPLATGPRGLQVYAARRGDAVEVVVAPSAAARAQPFSLGIQFQQSNGLSGLQNQCGHIRFALGTAGDGDMATVQADIPLPPKEGERQPDNHIAEALGLDKLPADQQSSRARLLRIGISTTRTSRDSEALLSVAMGWVGKERNLF